MKSTGGIHHGGLDAAHVGDQAAGLEISPVGLEKVHDGAGVEAKVDHVGAGDGRLCVVGKAVGHIVGGGKLKSGGVPVYPQDLKVFKALQGHGHRAAN